MKRIFFLTCSLRFILISYSQSQSTDQFRYEEAKSHQISDVPLQRAHHALVYDEEKKVIVLTAGSTPVDGGKNFTFYNDLWAFDGQRWNHLGNVGDRRSGPGIAYDTKRKQIVSFGGYSGDKSLGDLRIYTNNTWEVKTDIPEMASTEPGFVYDTHRDYFIAFGGSGERGKVNATTWEWDGEIWRKKDIPGPPGRQAFAMVYDTKRMKTVLFGGMGDTPQNSYNDTWEYDGTKWTRVDTAGPGARLAMGYTYDSKRGLFIIFGGMGEKGNLGDTWSWDGEKWKQLAATGPLPRLMGYMAYDKKRDKIVLFGGRVKWPQDANDTWEWDGRKWSEVSFVK